MATMSASIGSSGSGWYWSSQAPTPMNTIASPERSSVESKKAPNGVPLPWARVKLGARRRCNSGAPEHPLCWPRALKRH